VPKPSGLRIEASAPVPAPSTEELSPRKRSGRALGIARIGAGAVLFAAVGIAVARSWTEVRETVAQIELGQLATAEALVMAGLLLSVLTWRRALREVGAKVRTSTASKIYLLGQLGKYIPGSLWAIAAQTELARGAGVLRSRALTASLVAVGVNTVTGLALGLCLLPASTGMEPSRMLALVLLVGCCTLVLSPPVLSRLVDACLRLIKRPALARPISWLGIAETCGWSLGTWLTYSLGVWVLTVAAGAPAATALLLCLAGVPLAMTLGVLVFVAPSGIGVREIVLITVLAPVLERPEALAVALVARLVFTSGDLLAAALVLPVRLNASELAA
jgi:uncharacterized membrane protein YbhN (UPF0104 family)